MSNKEHILDVDKIDVIGAYLTENPRHATEVSGIADVPEQQMFILLKSVLPDDWEIIPEGSIAKITFTDANNKIDHAETTPDFRIRRPGRNENIFLEITTANYNGTDPKERQKQVMRIVKKMRPEKKIRYLVLYGKHLDKIHAEHPEINFANGTKIRESTTA